MIGDDKIQQVKDAILVTGHRPDVHYDHLRELKWQWPTLYRAVLGLLSEDERLYTLRRMRGML